MKKGICNYLFKKNSITLILNAMQTKACRLKLSSKILIVMNMLMFVTNAAVDCSTFDKTTCPADSCTVDAAMLCVIRTCASYETELSLCPLDRCVVD